MSNKLTPWFPAGDNPVRAGAYIVQDDEPDGTAYYSWFQNGLFHGFWGSPYDALDAFKKRGKAHAKKRMPGWSVVTKWRGLAEAPK